MLGFDTSAYRPPHRVLWSKKMNDILIDQVFQSDTKLFAVAYGKVGYELLEINPRTGDSLMMFSLEG